MKRFVDGPLSSLFKPLSLSGNVSLEKAPRNGISRQMAEAFEHAPGGDCVCRGIPFRIRKPVLITDKAVTVKFEPFKAPWLVFMHTSDIRPLRDEKGAWIQPFTGYGRLAEHAATYVLLYADGTEARAVIRRRHEIGMFERPWGENTFESVPHVKPRPIRAHHEQTTRFWGQSQQRAHVDDGGPWAEWIWAWENPNPRKPINGIRFEPVSGAVLVSAISAGWCSSQPLRWDTRRKAILTLPKGEEFKPDLDGRGLLDQIQLDLGQVISATRRPLYPGKNWARTYNNRLPGFSERDILVEYTSHPDARFHLAGGKTVPVSKLESAAKSGPLQVVAPADRRVRFRVVEKGSGRAVPVKLHIHGEAGEYLPPVDRHRIPNKAWFEDYSVDFLHQGKHWCTYIPGETTIDLPVGRVYVEVSKGLEIRPVRKAVQISRATQEIVIELEKVLPWREKGWVSADTHVHFLSPTSALLEGAGEGVNVVNLLASQWAELMTNVGDFDGRTTHGSKEAGGDGETLVRVGTENRQHILGHISLLGYNGGIIAPMTTGGPNESAIGDPVECLLTEWGTQCKKQDGVVVIPHFPNPRAEHAATIVAGAADAVEMTSAGELYGGINPYSLADWYRYLNCGYMVAAVGGTDKMYASTPVGAVRTYARIDPKREFTYESWKEAIRNGNTFVTYGPLMEFHVDGRLPGSRIEMKRSGGTVDVAWKVASVTVPMSRVELIVNGEIRESRAVNPREDEGHWTVKVYKSSWAALLVRGHYADKPEIVAAHSSAVAIEVEGTRLMAAADAVTILEQIEGAMAFIDTVGTRADVRRLKEMRLVLTGAHRSLHNRLHQQGHYHHHTPLDDHAAHHADSA